jgi:NAD(P)-dependent dehydrogenase (short-subunit alcohol dehydrogenase family)
MPGTNPVILILGAGPQIGASVARHFASKGFKVGLAARSVKESESTDSQLNIPSDFSKSDDVVSAFSKIREKFGIPSVVLYNGKPLHGSSW